MAEVTLLACVQHTRGSPAISRRHSARTASTVVTVPVGFQAGGSPANRPREPAPGPRATGGRMMEQVAAPAVGPSSVGMVVGPPDHRWGVGVVMASSVFVRLVGGGVTVAGPRLMAGFPSGSRPGVTMAPYRDKGAVIAPSSKNLVAAMRAATCGLQRQSPAPRAGGLLCRVLSLPFHVKCETGELSQAH